MGGWVGGWRKKQTSQHDFLGLGGWVGGWVGGLNEVLFLYMGKWVGGWVMGRKRRTRQFECATVS